jgi:hypothetical protein
LPPMIELGFLWWSELRSRAAHARVLATGAATFGAYSSS